jgi:NAD(P)-dependent dehydrogenase (short-subunit alcohol dehydrogenase family)
MLAVITGGTTGLGGELSTQLRDAGYRVLTIGRQGNLLWDMSAPDARPRADIRQAVADEDVLLIINAATIDPLGPIGTLQDDEIRTAVEVNYVSVAMLLADIAGLPASLHVALISTGAARRPIPGWSSYCASKAATEMLVDCFALENPDAIVTRIDPGIVDTPMQERIAEWRGTTMAGLQTPQRAARLVLLHIHSRRHMPKAG